MREAIATGILLPQPRAERMTGADIDRGRGDYVVPRPTLPAELGGLPEDAPEAPRYRTNRAEIRRLAKRAGRKSGGKKR